MQASGPQLLVATLVAFVIGFASIAWLLKFVADHSLNWFVGYRVILGLVVMGLLAGGAINAT
jgi:undecaprenyl-diphosphatase